MELIAFASGKGGTGKTLLASCLGYALIRSGHRVLMIDADPATDGLSLFLLGMDGMRQVGSFKESNTFTGVLRQYQQTGQIQWEAYKINRSWSDEEGGHGVFYDTIISGKGLYGDPVSGPVVPDLDRSTFDAAVRELFASVTASNQYDYVIVDTRGGFAFESTDVCALANSFVVVTEADATSFYQDRNLVRRISDAAQQMNAKPLLRSFIVNKTSEWEFTDPKADLRKVEQSFRLEIEKEFPVKFLDTYPVPLDIEALKAYKTQRIPYLAAKSSLFAYATLSAYRDILQVVTARWSEDQAKQWNALVETVSGAIAERNQKAKEERESQAERDRQLAAFQTENKQLQERTASLEREMQRLENRYERELQRSTEILKSPVFSQAPPAATSPAPSQASATAAGGTAAAPVGIGWRRWLLVGVGLLGLLAVAGLAVYVRLGTNSQEALLRNAYDQTLPVALRVENVKKLSQRGYTSFDGINLRGANFSDAKLDRISFRSATLPAASFRRASLSACDLSGADLSGADLAEANLSHCRLLRTNLTEAQLERADLRGADLTGAIVQASQVESAITDGTTLGIVSAAEAPSIVPSLRPVHTQNWQDVPVVATLPTGTVSTFFDNWNLDAVQNSPTQPTRFRITQTIHLTDIADYHWNDGRGAEPERNYITLRKLDGARKFPRWPVRGIPRQGGVANATWECQPGMDLLPGVYEVVDSSPQSWSQNAASGNKGFSRISGYAVGKRERKRAPGSFPMGKY
jgi:uncharacterized protein YjbI with pentapeptide repeats/MinD-like ATPase involved in chromosome partitioning or flagellar assembly